MAITAQPAVRRLISRFVVAERARRDDLDRREAGAVADVDERQPGLGVAPGAHPAADRDFAAGGELARERVLDADHRHALNPCRCGPIYGTDSLTERRYARRYTRTHVHPPRSSRTRTHPGLSRRHARRDRPALRRQADRLFGLGLRGGPGPRRTRRTIRSPSRTASASMSMPTAWRWSTAPRSTSSSRA